MSDKPDPMTEQHLKRELTAMTEPNANSTDLWREALQQTRRESTRGTRAIPGRGRRLVGLSALVTASLAIVVGIGAWIGSAPQPVVTMESATVAPPAASSGMDITRSLDRMLPDSAEARRSLDSPRLLSSSARQLDSSGISQHQQQIDLLGRMANTQHLERSGEYRDSRILAEKAELSDTARGRRPERTLDTAADDVAIGHEARSTAAFAAAEPQTEASPKPERAEKPTWRLLEHRTDIGIRVPDVAATANAVQAIADTDADEFVSEISVQGEAHRARAAVVLRVASARHNAVVTDVSRLGSVISMESQTEDLSLEADEIDAEMIAAEKTEQDFRDLYYNYQTPDFDNASRQLRNAASARSQVNDLMAKRAKLVDRAAWSNIRVLIVAEPPPRPVGAQESGTLQSKSFLYKLRTEAREAMSDTGSGLLALTRPVIIALPIAMIGSGLVSLLWWRRKSVSQ